MAPRNPVFSKNSLEKFLEILGSDSPSPGGGAAAALTGAQGAALIEMVSRLNDARFRKKDPKGDHSQAKKRIAVFEKSRLRYLKLISDDTAAFQKISQAYRKGKDSPSYQTALMKGYSVPLEMAELAVNTMRSGLDERGRTSKWLYSDLVEAGILLDAAFCAARLNVEINLKDLADQSTAGRVTTKLDELQRESSQLKNELKGGIAS